VTSQTAHTNPNYENFLRMPLVVDNGILLLIVEIVAQFASSKLGR